MPSVFLNGRFLERDDARVSTFDAGIQHAVGLFETMSGVVEDGKARVRALDRHLARIAESARVLGLSDALATHALAEAVLQTIEHAAPELGPEGRARVRLTITGGDLNLLQRSRTTPVDPTILITAQAQTAYPAAMFERGARVGVASWRANPFDPTAGHKTLNYWTRLRELQLAAREGLDESLVFQITNHLAGGSVSNALLVKDGAIITPIARGEEADIARTSGGEHDANGEPAGSPGALPSPVLPGVTRSLVLDAAKEMGLRVERRMVSIDDVLGADEAMLTNSSWGVLPIVQVAGHAIAGGAPGPIAAAMRARWAELL
ncbi:MAG: aminotransferase class IV [Phycisphaerales bacterium]|nr:aminotransferase class IV [Phycisphaerales bacterium]